MNRIKSAARREAWSDSRNPFSRTRSHDPRTTYDEEEALPHVRHANTEPVPHSPIEPGIINRPTSHAGPATGPAISAADKEAGITSEDTIVPGTGSTARPRSEEEKARSRFLSRFGKHSKEEKRPETTDSEETKGPKHAHKKFTVASQIRSIFLGSWVNIFLIAAPVGIALGATHQNFIAVFVVNFIAIIPLAALLSYATEEIALRVGETLGGLLNATFGNAVEVIVSVIALTKDEIVIVKTSLIGSILSNLLLVLGMCFLFGGLRREEQFFNTTVAQTAASLLVLAIASVIIPTVFDLWVSNTGVDKVAAISRGTSIILLFVYAMYLLFQLKTHSTMYNQESRKVPMKPRKKHLTPGNIQRGRRGRRGRGRGAGTHGGG
ncbi:hypothetical protein VE04_09479 [Pseudogymnoascus sp. 24MN13]|nr:hypothetical protein VE04_09479 [Pseudogymnoascus sp. 24MN13]